MSLHAYSHAACTVSHDIIYREWLKMVKLERKEDLKTLFQ